MQEKRCCSVKSEASSVFAASSRVTEGVIFKQNKKLLGCFPSSLPQQPADFVFVWWGGL